MKIAFGKRLKELRTEKNLTQKQLGEIFKVKQTSISDWETRELEPGYQMLLDLAEYFEVSTDYLLGKDY